MARAASPRVEDVLPLKPADFHILMVLLEGERHGYGIMQEVEEQSRGQVHLEVGSLYRLIARLTALGVVAESQRRRSDDDRRRYYRITPFGRDVAKREAHRLADVVQAARARELLDDWDPA